MNLIIRCRAWRRIAIAAGFVLSWTPELFGPQPVLAVEVSDALREASKRYAEAFTKADFAAVADQWTTGAELTEGGGTVTGRDKIVESLQRWRQRHPKATLAIEVTGIDLLGESAARVRGRLLFTPEPNDKPHVSLFESLRVNEGGTWRIAESRVGPSATALLDDLEWLLGTWQATDAKTGTSFELRYEKAIGGRAFLGRSSIRPKKGPSVEAIELIHADARDGGVRSWIVDSTGARADGFFDSDGTSFNRTLSGVSGEAVGSGRVQWVQVLTPGPNDRMVVHSIDRVVEGRPLPDGEPLSYRKVR